MRQSYSQATGSLFQTHGDVDLDDTSEEDELHRQLEALEEESRKNKVRVLIFDTKIIPQIHVTSASQTGQKKSSAEEANPQRKEKGKGRKKQSIVYETSPCPDNIFPFLDPGG